MTENTNGSPSIEGRPIEEACERIATGDDRERVRQALGHVSDDGVVSRAGARSGLSEASLRVATVENRTEVAADALEEARAVAEEHPDIAPIERRLAGFDERLSAIRADRDGLGERLDEIADGVESMPLHDLGLELQELSATARSAQQAADELYVDVEEFEEWLDNPRVRREDLHADCDAIEDALAELRRIAGELEGATEGSTEGIASEDPGVAWVDTRFRCQVLALLLADVHEEHAALEEWARDRAEQPPDDGDPGPQERAMTERLAALRAEREDLARRLREVETDAWASRFRDALDRFEAALAELSPPIDWGEVQSLLETHRHRIDGPE